MFILQPQMARTILYFIPTISTPPMRQPQNKVLRTGSPKQLHTNLKGGAI